jgi:hypothetical protein
MLDLTKVRVTKEEAEKITARMSNWDKLHASFQAKPPSVEDLEKMLKVETSGRKRMLLTSRVFGIYNRTVREENERHVLNMLHAK